MTRVKHHLSCSHCGAKMKYYGSKPAVHCLQCSAPINVPSPTRSLAGAAPTTNDEKSLLPANQAVNFASSAQTSSPSEQASYIDVPWTHHLADLPIGIVLGVACFAAASYMKEAIGEPGLLSLFIAGLIVLVILYYVNQTLNRTSSMEAGLGRRLLQLPATVCVLFFLTLLAFDVFGPVEEGLVRRMVAGKRTPAPVVATHYPPPEGATSQRREPDQAPVGRVPHHDETRQRDQWNNVDFILVNASHLVVGLRAQDVRRQPQFTVVAKSAGQDESLSNEQSTDAAKGPKTAQVIEHFWKRRLPIFSYDPGLTSRIFADVAVGDVLQGEIRDQVSQFWTPTRFVPDRPLMAYHDLRTNLRRFGFQLESTDNSLLFTELVPTRHWSRSHDRPDVVDGFAAERIDRTTRVVPDSVVENLLPTDLRQQADLLDVFVMNVLQTLQARQSVATSLGEMRAPSLYVDEVSPDRSVDDQLKTMHDEMAKKNRDVAEKLTSFLRPHEGRVSNGWEFLDQMTRLVTEKSQELERASLSRDIRARLTEEVEFLRGYLRSFRALQEQQRSLTGEIRKRLSRAQVHMVDRSKEFKNILSKKVAGQQWANDTVTVDEALNSGLIDATHVLITEIRHGSTPGCCELSMRLVDVATGTILWEDQGERRGASSIQGGSSIQKAPASATTPNASQPILLAGRWRSNDGDEFDVTDDGANVTMKLVWSDRVSELEVKLRRDDSGKLSTTSSYMVFKNETIRRKPTVTVRAIDAEHFSLEITNFVYNSRTRKVEANGNLTYPFKKTESRAGASTRPEKE